MAAFQLDRAPEPLILRNVSPPWSNVPLDLWISSLRGPPFQGNALRFH